MTQDPLHALELFFVLDDHELGQLKQVELLPNGKEIRVTRENVIRYIHLAAHYKLNKRIRRASGAFLSGLFEVLYCCCFFFAVAILSPFRGFLSVCELNKRAWTMLCGKQVIRPEYMRMFHAHELQILISGVQVDKIDVEDLKRNCDVPRGVEPQQIAWLWEVLSEMSGEDQVPIFHELFSKSFFFVLLMNA